MGVGLRRGEIHEAGTEKRGRDEVGSERKQE